MNICQDCGMVCQPTEYHPMAACLMFKACHDGDQVRANLAAVVKQEREAILAAIDDVEEPPYSGYECPNTFNDGKWAAAAAIRARSSMESK